MGGDFTVSGGGTLSVSTGEMAEHAATLRQFAATAEASRHRLATVASFLDDPRLIREDAPISALQAHRAIDDCVAMLSSTRGQAELLVSLLDLAAAGYGRAEHLARATAEGLAGALAYSLGLVYPLLLTWFTPHAVGAAAAWLLTPEERRRRAIEWFEENAQMLSDPRVVDLVRLAVSSVDEFGAGAMRLPPALLDILGDETLGLLGYGTSAGIITGTVRALGLARETPVSVSRTNLALPGPPPAGFGDLAKRIPSHASQIRIDRVEMPSGPDRYIVYVGGTRDGGLEASREPFDSTSNLSNAASGAPLDMGDAGSTRAVALAMAEAGVTSESPVIFAGYSQGGSTATVLADSGDYNVHGILTVGGPTGELPVPDGVPYIALEHDEDIVPAVGGVHRDLDTVVARREVFADGDVPTTSVLPAHDLGLYRESAALLDSAHDPRVVEAGEAFTEFSSGATSVIPSLWRARREDQ